MLGLLLLLTHSACSVALRSSFLVPVCVAQSARGGRCGRGCAGGIGTLVHGTGSYNLTGAARLPGDGRRRHFAQYGQDVLVDQIFPRGTKGFFLEIGAADGELGSNTLFLERERGWDGLLVDANPILFDRMIRKDRNCFMLLACLSSRFKEMEFHLAGEVTTAAAALSPYRKQRWQRQLAAGERRCTQCVNVKVALDAIGRRHIQYFSLDVEGSEMEVLQSIDWDSVTVDLFSIEVWENEKEIDAFMTARGYTRAMRMGPDAFYSHHPIRITEAMFEETSRALSLRGDGWKFEIL